MEKQIAESLKDNAFLPLRESALIRAMCLSVITGNDLALLM